MVNSEQCAERQKLAQSLAAAIHQTYMARNHLQAAKTDKTADTAPLIIALEQAKSKEREAEKAHHKHVEEHGCLLNGMTRPGS